MNIQLNEIEIETEEAVVEKLIFLPKDVYQQIREHLKSDAFTSKDKGLVNVPVQTRIGRVHVTCEVKTKK